MNVLTFEQHLNEKSPCWTNYEQRGMKKGKNGKQVPNCVGPIQEDSEATETIQEFSKNRLAGAKKIAMAAKEKGGDALLTYHHFHVKLSYYQQSVDGELDMQTVKGEYDILLTDLYEATRNSMNISQIEFQELVGKIEVLGEILIRKGTNQ